MTNPLKSNLINQIAKDHSGILYIMDNVSNKQEIEHFNNQNIKVVTCCNKNVIKISYITDFIKEYSINVVIIDNIETLFSVDECGDIFSKRRYIANELLDILRYKENLRIIVFEHKDNNNSLKEVSDFVFKINNDKDNVKVLKFRDYTNDDHKHEPFRFISDNISGITTIVIEDVKEMKLEFSIDGFVKQIVITEDI